MIVPVKGQPFAGRIGTVSTVMTNGEVFAAFGGSDGGAMWYRPSEYAEIDAAAFLSDGFGVAALIKAEGLEESAAEFQQEAVDMMGLIGPARISTTAMRARAAEYRAADAARTTSGPRVEGGGSIRDGGLIVGGGYVFPSRQITDGLPTPALASAAQATAAAFDEAAMVCQRIQDDKEFPESGPGVVAAKIVFRGMAGAYRGGNTSEAKS